MPAPLLWPLAAFLAACAALSLRRAWRPAAAWAALLGLGQAAALELTRSGPVVTYHHLRPDLASPSQRLALGVLVAQALLVVVGLARRKDSVRVLLREHLRPWQALVLVVALALASAKVARPAGAFALELAASTVLHGVALANAALVALALAPDTARALAGRCERWLGARPVADGPEPGGVDGFALSVATWAVVVPALLALLVYQRHPHVPDEVVYLLHARYLAAGELWLPAPPVPAAFDVDLMLLDGERWYCPVPIGWPLALAVGAFLGAPWLVNPVLSGAGILLAYLLARELASRWTARVVILLLAASPWFLFLGMSYMTHPWQLACTLLAALGVARSRRTGSLAWALGGGAALGMVALIRPLDGLVLAALLGLWAIGVGGARLRVPATALLVLGAALVGGLTLPYNARMTGSAGKFPIMLYNDLTYQPGSNDLGFGPEKGAGMDWRGLDPWPGHDPLQAAVNHQFNLFQLDAETFGWASGSLWPVLLALAWCLRRRADRLMWATIGATVLASSFYYFAGGPDFGARYWYTAIGPLAWLAASGLGELERRFGAGRALAVPLALSLAALTTFVPWRAHDKYPGYRGMRPDVRELAREHGFGASLVLVRGRRHPDYASAAVYNPLDWDAAAPIYAWDRDDETRLAVLQRYADRAVWVVDGPSETGAGYAVSEGPLGALELIERAKEDLLR